MFKPTLIGYAHCDLPCGIYDPAQAKIEAQSIKAAMEKYAASSDNDFKSRAVAVKEERSEMVKHHLWVLWTDYFKAPHFEKYPHSTPCSMKRPSLLVLVEQRELTTSQLPTSFLQRSKRSQLFFGRQRRLN